MLYRCRIWKFHTRVRQASFLTRHSDAQEEFLYPTLIQMKDSLSIEYTCFHPRHPRFSMLKWRRALLTNQWNKFGVMLSLLLTAIFQYVAVLDTAISDITRLVL
jgi:hypothetical protein